MIAMPPPRSALAFLALVLSGTAACAGDADRVALRVQRDTVGDTVVVRTLAGQVWDGHRTLQPELRIGAFEGRDVYMLGDVRGLAVSSDGEIYLYDHQVPALRKYGPDGEFMATFGREGGGPGEYKQSDGGLAVLPDGRVLLRDPGNARISVFSGTGEYLDGWPLRGGYFTSRPLYVDTTGQAYTQIWGAGEDGDRYTALQPVGPDGSVRDSLLVPEWDFEEAGISFSSERMSFRNQVPFTPRDHWSFSPHGYFVGGVSDRYAVDLFHPDGTVLRIRQDREAVPVDPAEKEARRRSVVQSFRRMAPDWSWNGPPIPDAKPAFRDLAVGTDGRIWVRLHQPGYLAEEADPDDPEAVDEWEEPVVWDVYEPDGTFLGQVHAPGALSTSPTPVFGTDHVWAVTTDELDVEYLTRFRIAPAADFASESSGD